MLGESVFPYRRKRILVVDDDSVVRESLIEQLTDRFGSKVEIAEADCGQRAIVMLGERIYDAVICDLDMPNGNGMNVFVFLKKAKLDPCFVFFTNARHVEFPPSDSHSLGVVQKPDSKFVLEKLEGCLLWKT